MLLEEFDYNLDPDLIAQYPCAERDHSRMMTVDRSTDRIENHFFYEIVHFFKKGDVLVINDTRVIPARLYARKPTGSLLEVFLVKDRGDQGWEALIRPAKRVQSG